MGCDRFHRPSGCFNSQPPEGGWIESMPLDKLVPVSTHSRPKAAGKLLFVGGGVVAVSTHSRPKAAGFQSSSRARCPWPFQLTAARRRLGMAAWVHKPA